MKTFSGFLYSTLFGWKIKGEFPDIPKSITIFAPHTSNWDSFLGKLYLNEIGLKYYVLAKKELFTFPLGILMRAVRALPIDRKNRKADYVGQITEVINRMENIHIFIAPEGTRKGVGKWKKGFYHMAVRARVPIVAVYLDYHKKEIGIGGVIHNVDSLDVVMKEINTIYQNVVPKYPDNFLLESL
ncbi:MAG: 1-acyl-sn-glycerol-3-phosphate acyltransferase [Cyclobacteriaceae bacterium]|nr:1-acyl-sn-glycerol-3-phosphate acyltransferase [Cyclobacteriaceae bacterium]